MTLMLARPLGYVGLKAAEEAGHAAVKLAVFTFSAVLAGIAGALYVPQVGIINPGEFAPLNSIEVVVWVAVGGRGTLYGAVIGAVLVNYAKTKFTVLMHRRHIDGFAL